MTRSTVSLWFFEVVDVDISALGWRTLSTCDDLVPLDALDVTQVVVVEDANTALQNI